MKLCTEHRLKIHFSVLYIDINECASGNACSDKNAQCENTQGGFLCLCPLKYKTVNGTCVGKLRGRNCYFFTVDIYCLTAKFRRVWFGMEIF